MANNINKIQKDLQKDFRTLGEKISDGFTSTIGTWPFIIIQTIILIIWVTLNITAYINHWDPYPFILLNLALSMQAAYAAPIIMMSQNRQNAVDRIKSKKDFETDRKAEEEIEEIQQYLHRIENHKLLEIKKMLEEFQKRLDKIEKQSSK